MAIGNILAGGLVGLGQAAPAIATGVRDTTTAIMFDPIRKQIAEDYAKLLMLGDQQGKPQTSPGTKAMGPAMPLADIIAGLPGGNVPANATNIGTGGSQIAPTNTAERQALIERLQTNIGQLATSGRPEDQQISERVRADLQSFQQRQEDGAQRRTEIEAERRQREADRAIEQQRANTQATGTLAGIKSDRRQQALAEKRLGLDAEQIKVQGLASDRQYKLGLEQLQVDQTRERNTRSNILDQTISRLITDSTENTMGMTPGSPEYNMAVQELGNRILQARKELGGAYQPLGGGTDVDPIQTEYDKIVTSIRGLSPEEALSRLSIVQLETDAQKTAYDRIIKELSTAESSGKDVGYETSIETLPREQQVQRILQSNGYDPRASAQGNYSWLEEPNRQARAARAALQSPDAAGFDPWVKYKLTAIANYAR